MPYRDLSTSGLSARARPKFCPPNTTIGPAMLAAEVFGKHLRHLDHTWEIFAELPEF
jgi:hypothetical protein